VLRAPTDQGGASKGCGIINFASEKSARKAVDAINAATNLDGLQVDPNSKPENPKP
jgi:hypothetical protein